MFLKRAATDASSSATTHATAPHPPPPPPPPPPTETAAAAAPVATDTISAASASSRGSTASTTTTTTTTSRSSIFSTFSAFSTISAFSNKTTNAKQAAAAAAAATSPEPTVEGPTAFNPVDVTPPIAFVPAVTDTSVFFPRNPNSKHLAHLTALNPSSPPSASAAPSTTPSAVPSTAASTATSPAPSIHAGVQRATVPPLNTLPPLKLATQTATTAGPFHGPISPTPSTMSHFSFSHLPSFHGSVIGVSHLPNIPQATVMRLVQTYFAIQALKAIGYDAAVAGRCAGIVHRVPFVFSGNSNEDEPEEGDWEGLTGGADLFGEAGVDLVLSRIGEPQYTEESVGEVLAKRFPQWFYLQEVDLEHEMLMTDSASILSSDTAARRGSVTGHRRTRSHPGEIVLPESTSVPTTRPRSGTATTVTPNSPPEPRKILFFHDPSNLLNASLAALSFSAPSTPAGGTTSTLPPIDFSSVISFAVDHPPPPVSPCAETANSSTTASDSGEDIPTQVTLRTPLSLHLHYLTGTGTGTGTGSKCLAQAHPYLWLPPLSQTTLATPNPVITVELGAQAYPVPLPTLPLPILLITSLLTAHGLLRSLSMHDRKMGNIAIRQAVNLASFIRMRGGVGTAADGGGMVPLPGGVPKDALGVLCRLRGERGTEERRVVLWALRSGIAATEPPRTPGGSPAPVSAIPQPGALKRTFTTGTNNQLRELVLVNRRDTEGWRRSAPAAVDYYRNSTGAATPSVRSVSGISVTSGAGRNSMGYLAEEGEEDGASEGEADSIEERKSGELLEKERAGTPGGVVGDGGTVPVPKKTSMRWSFKGWGSVSAGQK